MTQRVDAFECSLIAQVLDEHAGGILDTADALGVPKHTLHEKMKKFDLERNDFR